MIIFPHFQLKFGRRRAREVAAEWRQKGGEGEDGGWMYKGERGGSGGGGGASAR